MEERIPVILDIADATETAWQSPAARGRKEVEEMASACHGDLWCG